MGARPDLGQVRPRACTPTDQVPTRIDLHLESRGAHPAGCKVESLLLLGAVAGPVRPVRGADLVQLLEAVEDALGVRLGQR